jgi:His/Glu/Gln/Arg/opine family amino acid ABC transporter permease subunit
MTQFIGSYWTAYLHGLCVALVVSIAAMALSVALGTFGALGRRSHNPFVRFVSSAYVGIFRGLPPLVALFIVYFGLPTWAQATHNSVVQSLMSPLDHRLIAAAIAFGITSGAYSTEIIRGSLAAVPAEQIESGRSIGMSRFLTFRRVIAPQALRIALGPLSNEYVSLLKGTSLASIIGVSELLREAQTAASTTFRELLAYSMAGVYYIVVVLLMQFLVNIAEKRASRGLVSMEHLG